MNYMEIIYWFRKSDRNPEAGTLQAQIRIDGVVSKPFTTGIDCLRKNWNVEEKCFEGKNSSQKEKALKAFERRMYDILSTLEAQTPNKFIHPAKIIEVHRKDRQKNKEVIKFFTMPDAFRLYSKLREELSNAEQLDSETLESDQKYIKNILRFLEETKRLTLPATSINESVMDEFVHWMLVKKRTNYYINRHLMLVKRVQKLCHKRGLMDFLPVDGMGNLKVKEKLPVVLEPWEVEKLCNHQFPEALQAVADAWIFCQETSFAYTDYVSLKNEYLQEDDEGIVWIVRERNKTDERHLVPLSDRALQIIAKYGGDLESLPRRCNQTVNSYLKEIAKYAGVNPKLNFHMARKTFVHNSLNYKGMRDVTIAQTVGWSSTKMLKVYARINRESIKREFFGKK